MFDFFAALFWLSILGVGIGSIKPTWVQYWGKERTKRTARRWYGLFAVLCFIGAGVVMDKSSPAPQVVQAQLAPSGPIVQSTPPSRATSAAVEQAADEAEKGHKQAEANREKINRETEASIAALAAKKEEAKSDASKTPQQTQTVNSGTLSDTEKTCIIAYRDRLLTISTETDTGTHGIDVQIQAVTKGRGNLTGLYLAASDAKKTVEKGMEAVRGLEPPVNLPEDLAKGLKTASSGIWLGFMERRDAYESLMSYIDNGKPSDMLKFKEKVQDSDKHCLLAALALSDVFTKAGIPWEPKDNKASGKTNHKKGK